MSNIEKPQSLGDVVIFNTEDGAVNVQLDLVDETVWVNQSGIAELFSTSKQVVSYHLGNIFKEGELVQNSVVKEILTTAEDNKRYKVKFYNLDAVIAVGYRINSKQATACKRKRKKKEGRAGMARPVCLHGAEERKDESLAKKKAG